MPPRIPLRPVVGPSSSLGRASLPSTSIPSVCFLCSLSSDAQPATSRPRRQTNRPRKSWHYSRFQSTAATATASRSRTDARTELTETLLELQKTAPNYVNLSRLQLALQGLRQNPGEESVRVAILGLANGGPDSGRKAKELLKVLLADSLTPEEEWERQMADHDPRQPLVVRIRPQRQGDQDGFLQISKTNLLHELEISRPGLNDLHLELLLSEVSPFTAGAPNETKAAVDAEETLLVPTVDIPSNTGRVNPITTPVHKSIVVTEGIMGAAAVASLPLLESREAVLAAVDLPGYSPSESEGELTFQPVDVAAAQRGVDLFREDLGNAMPSQKMYQQSNVPALLAWLKNGVATEDSTTKPVVRQLVASLLRNASAAVQKEEAGQLGGILASGTTAAGAAASPALNKALADWSQAAHEELQLQLDLAFASRRWRRLGWWKLFWRVDDVGALTNEILSQRFLPGAERELVYLAGRIREAGAAAPIYSQPAHEEAVVGTTAPAGSGPSADGLSSKWPGHLGFTRRYLHSETVPALQALAQKLVLQATSTSALAGSLSALLYVSSSVSTLYEAGAVAALGIVWSLRRMQQKWETARGFWEGDVREEGRKALRGAEASVADALGQDGKSGGLAGSLTRDDPESVEQRERAKILVEKAADALARMK